MRLSGRAYSISLYTFANFFFFSTLSSHTSSLTCAATVLVCIVLTSSFSLLPFPLRMDCCCCDYINISSPIFNFTFTRMPACPSCVGGFFVVGISQNSPPLRDFVRLCRLLCRGGIYNMCDLYCLWRRGGAVGCHFG